MESCIQSVWKTASSMSRTPEDLESPRGIVAIERPFPPENPKALPEASQS